MNKIHTVKATLSAQLQMLRVRIGEMVFAKQYIFPR